MLRALPSAQRQKELVTVTHLIGSDNPSQVPAVLFRGCF